MLCNDAILPHVVVVQGCRGAGVGVGMLRVLGIPLLEKFIGFTNIFKNELQGISGVGNIFKQNCLSCRSNPRKNMFGEHV